LLYKVKERANMNKVIDNKVKMEIVTPDLDMKSKTKYTDLTTGAYFYTIIFKNGFSKVTNVVKP
jgi:hypothetical protein